MKKWILLLSLWSISGWAGSHSNLNRQGVILDGYDPVSYFGSLLPTKGSDKFQVKEGEVIYWFSTEENKQAFLKNPSKYEPQFGGWCAYAVADSKSKVDVDPKSFIIQNGRLLVFYNGFFGDTKNKWQQTKNKDSASFLKDADKFWPEVKKQEP